VASHDGQVFDRETYVRANTTGTPEWHGQRLDDPHMVIVGGTGVLRCMVIDDVDAGAGRQSYRMPMTQTWVRAREGWNAATQPPQSRVQLQRVWYRAPCWFTYVWDDRPSSWLPDLSCSLSSMMSAIGTAKAMKNFSIQSQSFWSAKPVHSQ
jgi:hypothetical protein